MVVLSGSSPHTQGPLSAGVERGLQDRIIPAYAGPTGSTCTLRRSAWDHPRIRGVHKITPKAMNFEQGSSPHTRGPPSFHHFRAVHHGFIPAYAGSTLHRPVIVTDLQDHPRIRGVHPLNLNGQKSFMGSSPHTRGPR